MSGGQTPKRKTSRSRTRSRRAQWKASPLTLTECPRCHNPRLPHTVCPTCGTYRGREYPEAIKNA